MSCATLGSSSIRRLCPYRWHRRPTRGSSVRARCWEILQGQRLKCCDAIKRILFFKTDRLPPAILGVNQTYEACGCRRKLDFSEEAMIVMLYYIFAAVHNLTFHTGSRGQHQKQLINEFMHNSSSTKGHQAFDRPVTNNACKEANTCSSCKLP